MYHHKKINRMIMNNDEVREGARARFKVIIRHSQGRIHEKHRNLRTE
jgi:hypothetical protein